MTREGPIQLRCPLPSFEEHTKLDRITVQNNSIPKPSLWKSVQRWVSTDNHELVIAILTSFWQYLIIFQFQEFWWCIKLGDDQKSTKQIILTSAKMSSTKPWRTFYSGQQPRTRIAVHNNSTPWPPFWKMSQYEWDAHTLSIANLGVFNNSFDEDLLHS